MKNYASRRAKKGRLAYRTPSRFIYEAVKESLKRKFPKKGAKLFSKGMVKGKQKRIFHRLPPGRRPSFL